MKVLHVITGISRNGGGPSRSLQGLVAALCKAGVDAWTYSFENRYTWTVVCDNMVRGYEEVLNGRA